MDPVYLCLCCKYNNTKDANDLCDICTKPTIEMKNEKINKLISWYKSTKQRHKCRCGDALCTVCDTPFKAFVGYTHPRTIKKETVKLACNNHCCKCGNSQISIDRPDSENHGRFICIVCHMNNKKVEI